MKKIGIIFLLVVIIGLVVYPKFLNKENVIVNKPSKVLPTVSLGVNPGTMPQLVGQIIIDRKLDEKYGYKLKIVVVQPQNQITSLMTNKSQIVPTFITNVINLNKDGKDIKMFGFGLKIFCPFIADSSLQATAEDPLKGKKVAILKKPSAPYNILEKAMKNNSLNLSDYFVLTEGDLFSLPILLQKGEVDAANICNVVSMSKLLSKNKYKIIDSTENIIKKQLKNGSVNDVPFTVMAAQGKWIKENPILARSYLLSQNDAYMYLQTNFEDFTKTELYKKSFGLEQEETNTLMSIVKENNYFSYPKWEKSIETIKEFIKDDFDAASFVILK